MIIKVEDMKTHMTLIFAIFINPLKEEEGGRDDHPPTPTCLLSIYFLFIFAGQFRCPRGHEHLETVTTRRVQRPPPTLVSPTAPPQRLLIFTGRRTEPEPSAGTVRDGFHPEGRELTLRAAR